MRFFACVLVLMCLVGCGASARAEEVAPPEVEARAAILIERSSGRVLYELNADELLPIASITKVMTALLTIEQCDPDDVVTVSENASGVMGTSLYLSAGEQLTVHQMLLGLMLRSGNDAAVALAEHVASDVYEFTRQMNDRAALLGADAHFTNPHGLDEQEHVASARGMALIANEAMDYPAFRALVTTGEAVIPWPGNQYDRALTNKNRLIKQYENATGVKTGFTNKAGRCLIFSAERDDMELLGVVLNCGNWFDAAMDLLDWGFESYQMRTFLHVNQEVERARVEDGMIESVDLVVPITLMAPMTENENAQLVVESCEVTRAPVEAGAALGRADVLIGGEVIASCPLIATQAVPVKTYRSGLMRSIRHFNPVG